MFQSDMLPIVLLSSVQFESKPDQTSDQLDEEVLECAVLGHVVDTPLVATIVSSGFDGADTDDGVLCSLFEPKDFSIRELMSWRRLVSDSET